MTQPPAPAPIYRLPAQEIESTQRAFLDSIGMKGYRVIGSTQHYELRDVPAKTSTGTVIPGQFVKELQPTEFLDWVVLGPDGKQQTMIVQPTQLGRIHEDDPLESFGNYKVIVPPKETGPAAATPAAPSPLNDWVLADEQGNPIPPGNPEGKTPKFRIDPKDPTNRFQLPDPAKEPEGSVTTFGNDLVLVKPDGTVTTLRTKPAAAETFNVPGIGVVRYDPATDTTKVIQPAAPEKPQVQDPSKFVWQDIPGTDQQQAYQVVEGKLQAIEGYTRPASEGRATTLLNDPNSRYLIWVNDKGEEVARLEKPGWQPQREALTPNTVVGELPIYNPEKGQIEWVPNQNQIKASQAVSDLAKGLGLTIGAGSMSEEQAQNLITAAVNTMNARTSALSGQVSAAGETLGAIQQGAQTGAGILQNRVSETSGLIQNLGALPFQGKSPMLNIPSETAVQGMISGAAGMTTALGGGPGVYEAAANLVQRADPANRLGANAQQAYAGLADATAKFQQLTGRLPPLAQAAAQPMPATGGFTPGVTAGAPTAATPVPNPVAQPPPGMPKRIVQPKRPQPMAGLGSMTPGAAWNPNLISAGMNWQAQQRGGGMPAPVTININSPA